MFGTLAALSVTGVTVNDETEALRDLRVESPAGFESAMRIVSTVGGGWGVTVVATAVATWLLVRRRIAAALLFAAMMIGASLNGALKALFDRPRPDLGSGQSPFSGLAFPSGHAMSSAILVAALVVLAWPSRWRLPVLVAGSIAAAVVGLSRLVLGAHYPSDVLGGWAFALAWVTALCLVFGSLQRRPRLHPHER